MEEHLFLEDAYVSYDRVKSFKDLHVWKRSMELIEEVYILSQSLPDNEKFGIVSQIRRAAVSIPSNISEGWGRKSSEAYLNHLKIANGSCCELETQLLIIEAVFKLEDHKIDKSKLLLEECGKMIRSMIKKLESINN